MPCKLLVAMSLILQVIACAPLEKDQDNPPSNGQLSLVDQTCTQVMGINRGEVYFAICHDRLSDALGARDQGQAMAGIYADCRQRGLVTGTAAFSACLAEAPEHESAATKSIAVAYTGGRDTETGRSFYAVSPSVRWNRERYACTRIGLLPGTASFEQCVAGLYGALQN
jgi:hypothetical protein